MRVAVDEFLLIRDVQILIDAAMRDDRLLYVVPRGNRRDGNAVKKVAKANGLTAEWSRTQKAWCIQIMSARELAEAKEAK